MSELKPCPFCGNNRILTRVDGDNSCSRCGAISGWWNNRPMENALHESLARVTAERNALMEAQRWIPVGERLPKIGERVLVWMKNDYQVIASLFYEKLWRNDAGSPVLNITHWRPLPEPPNDQPQPTAKTS